MAWFVEWTMFTLIAFTLHAYGYKAAHTPQDKILFYLGAFVFWSASMYQWVYDHTATNWQLVIVLVAPWMASFAWFMQALGAYVDDMDPKRRTRSFEP